MRRPRNSEQASDLEWPPPTADLDAVAVFTLADGAIDRRDRHAIRAPQRVRRSFRRPLIAAACVLATAVVAWPALWSPDRSMPSLQAVDISRAPVAAAPPPSAASRPMPPVPIPTAPPDDRIPATPAVSVPLTPEPPQRAALSSPAPDAAPAPAPSSPVEEPAPAVPVERLAGSALSGSVGVEPLRLETPAPPQPGPQGLIARAEPTDSRLLLASAPVSPVPPADVPRIHAVLRQYALAYRRLDAAAAGAVWPSLDTRALARAFEGLQSQSLVFDGCDVALNGARAQAACHGSATYVPRVGDRSPRTDARHWDFQLERVDGDQWRIRTASIR